MFRPRHVCWPARAEASSRLFPETGHSFLPHMLTQAITGCGDEVLGLMMGLLVAARSDLTVDEPLTRPFGSARFSEAICTDHKARYCENKDTRVGVSMSPIYIYDFGDEIRVIYKSTDCTSGWNTSYRGISGKTALRKVLTQVPQGCRRRQQPEIEDVISHLDELYAATQYMKTRAAIVFGPINKRCWVKRSPTSNYPLRTNCP